jgi:hypothetical protein
MAALTGDIYQMLKGKASEDRENQNITATAISQITPTSAQKSGTTKKGQVDSLLGNNNGTDASQERSVDRGQNVAVTDTATSTKPENDKSFLDVYNRTLALQKIWLGDDWEWDAKDAETFTNLVKVADDPEDAAGRYITAKGISNQLGVDTQLVYDHLDELSEYYTGDVYDPKKTTFAQKWLNGWTNNKIMSLEYEYMIAHSQGNDEKAAELESQIEAKKAELSDNSSAIPISKFDYISSIVLQNFAYMAQPALEGTAASKVINTIGTYAASVSGIYGPAILAGAKTLSVASSMIFSGKRMYEWAAGEAYYDYMHDEQYYGVQNRGQARIQATIQGALTAVIETALDGASSRILGLVSGNAIQTIGINTVAELGRKGMSSAAADAVINWVTGAVDEAGFNELPEYWINEIGSIIYKNSNGIIDEKTWSERKDEMLESMRDGLIVGAVYGGLAIPATVRNDRATALNLRREANQSTSFSEFAEKTKDMKPETMSDEDFETARTKVYEASQTQKKEWREETFKDTVLESEEISGQELFSTVNPETGEETAKALPDGKVYRTEEGELYSQTRTNNSQGTTEVFYGDPDSSALYGVVVLSSDGDTQTVQQVRVREGYESIRSEMVKNALRDTLSTETNVEWNPTTKGLQNVKNELINNNPDKTGLVYKSTVRGNDADIQSLKTQIKTANPNLSEAEATLAARLTSIADVGTKTIKYESTSKLTTEQTGGKSTADFRGATDTARTLIYVGQNSDTSTFVHELFHAVSLVRTKEAQNLSTSIHNALQNEAEANQLKAFISEHSQIWGKDADVDKIMSSLLSIGENTSADKWTVSQHENLARLHEAYRSSSRSIQASLPKAIRAILEKLTQFMNRVYNTLKDNVALNEDIAKAYDSLMGVSEAAQQVESKGAEAEFKAYGEKGIGEENKRTTTQGSGILYQEDEDGKHTEELVTSEEIQKYRAAQNGLLYQDSLIDGLSDLNSINPEDTDAINEKIQQIVNEDTESEKQAAIEADYLKSHNFNDEVFDSELPEGWEDNFESDYEDRLEREKELEDCLTNFPTTEARIRWEQETPAQEGAVDHSTVQGANNLDITYREFVTINDPQIDYVTDADTDAKKDTVFRNAIKDDTVLRRYLGIIGGAYLHDTRYTNRGYEMARDSYGRMQEVHYTQPYKYDDAYRQMLYTRLQTQLSDRKLNNAFAAALTDAPLSEAQLKAIRKELGDNARFYRNILALLTQDGAMLPKELVKEVKGLDLPAREDMDRMGITGLAELARKAGDEELRQKILSGRLKFGNDKDQQIYKQLTEYIKRADKEIKEQEKEISALDTKSKNFDEQKAQLEKAIDERTEIILDAEEVVNALTDTLITDENNSGKKYRTELAEKFSALRAEYNDLSPAREREHQKSETARQLDHAVKDGSRMREKKTAGHAGWRQQERGAKYGTEAWVKEVTGLYPDLKELVDAEAAKDKRKSYESVAKSVIENYRTDLKKQLDDLRVQMTGSAAKALSLNASKITRNLESIKALTDGTGVVILKDYLEDMQTQTKETAAALEDALKSIDKLNDKVYDAVTLERWKAAKAKADLQTKAKEKLAERTAELKAQSKEQISQERASFKEQFKEAETEFKGRIRELKSQHADDIKSLKAEQREKERQRRQYQAIRDEKQRIANAIVRPVSLNTIDYSRAQQITAIQALVDPEFRREWIYDLSVDPTQQQTHIPTMTIDQAKAYLAGLSEEERRNLYAAMPQDLMLRLEETRRPLNDYTIAELQDIATAVEELRAEGRAILQAKKDARNRLATSYQRSILTSLGTLKDRDKVLPESLEGEKEKKSWRRIYRGIMFSTRRMQELAQLLDGGYGNKGAAYRLLVEEKRFHQDNEAKATERRYTTVGKYLTKENIEQMTQQVKVDFGVFENSFTIDQLAYVWLSQDNEQNKAAVMYGSLLTPGEKGTLKKKGTDVNVLTGREQVTREWLVERAELIEDDADLEQVATDRYNKVLETAKKEITDRNLWDLVNAIRDDFNDPSNAQRLNATSIEVTNTPLTTLDNYLPIHRTQQTGEDTDSRASNAIFNFAGNSLDYNPEKGFTIDRIHISPRNQQPVDLSLLGVWQQAVKNEEHFIEFAGYVTKLRKVFESHGTGEVRREMQRKWTTALYKEVKNYIDVVANPDVSTSSHPTDSFFRTIRGKTGSAYLGWKASGIVLQAITSPASAFSELKPWEVFASYGTLGAHPIETIEFINNKSSFMKNRTMNPIIDEAIQRRNQWGLNKAQRAYNKFEEVGQIGLTLVDRYAVAGPWLAMYQRQLKEGLASDMTTAAAEERAIRKADEFIMRTQPVGDKTEIASMFRDSPEVLKTVLQFQTSLNVVWNNLTANMLGYIKNKQAAQIIGSLVGYGVAGVILGLVQTGFDDDDDAADVARKLGYWSVSQFTGAIPYASLLSLDSVAKYLMTGDYDWYMTNGTSVSPIQDKLLQGMIALGGGKPLKSLGKLGEAAGLMTGLPVSGFKEALDVVQQKSLAPLVGRE